MVTLVFSLLALGAGPSHFHESTCAAEPQQACSDGHCQTESCGGKGCGKCLGCKHRYKDPRGGIMGPMPQTCYTSRYGCYPATERYMNRYPAFHGTFYKHAYNYRNYFDYPWHAEMHEPSSQFAYETTSFDEPAAPVIDPAEQQPHPMPPPPMPAAQRMQPKAPVFSRSQFAANPAPVVQATAQTLLAPIVSSQQVPRKQPTVQEQDETESVSSKTMRSLRR